MRCWVGAGVWLLAACAAPAPLPVPDDLRPVADDLRAYVRRHLRELDLPGVWIAVLDVAPATGRQAIWAEGFERADPAPRPADAVHRVASISKLFTATALMRLVELGRVDLDAPVVTYLPDFAPRNPFGGEVTLRHLLGHRSGLVREPPVGHYFDPTGPSLAATVASLDDTALLGEPGATFRYSNLGFAVLGQVVERVTGRPFAEAVRELVLAPLALRDSDFAARPDLLARQPQAAMWTYDGRAIPLPGFEWGFGPAANLRSTTLDLVRFAQSWFPFSSQRVLWPETLAAMWQLPAGEASGCGLGFFVGTFDGHRRVGHDGAAYGFASALRALPEQGLAVAVVVTLDFANGVAEAIANRALWAALARRRGETLPPPIDPVPLGVAAARALAGHYRCGTNWVDLYERGGELFYDPNLGVRTRLRRAPDGALVADDPLEVEGARRLVQQANGRLHDGEEEYVRDDTVPAPPPAELLPLLGEYGWDHDVLVVYEDHGRLGVLIEWVLRELPDRTGPDTFVVRGGMYADHELRFERGADGRAVAVHLGATRFERRPDAPLGGYRVTPVRPIDALRREAVRAEPPAAAPGLRAADLVELAPFAPTLRFDLRYATADNFLGTAVYPATARARLQRPAAEALARVQQALAADGLGLLVFDAYRPWSVTRLFWDAVPAHLHHFVADPAEGSRHNRGCAVDLTLCDLATGEPVAMPSGFDEFTPRAYADWPGGTSEQRWFRERLRRAMAAEGFTVHEHEWWHFDFADWRQYPIGNAPL
ncbi:MAG: serine hydrolase [Planctomycetes bacterium]|nr:serine hydrolase [Planctomycetota bacterium]